MHKKLAADLSSLAHSILRMNNKEDVVALKEKAYEIYEKLAVLAYVEEYINAVPDASESKEELLEKIAEAEKRIEENEPIVKHDLVEEVEEIKEEEPEPIEEETKAEEEVEETIEKEEVLAVEEVQEPEVIEESEAEVEEEVEEVIEAKEKEIVEEETTEEPEEKEEVIELFDFEKEDEKVLTLDEELKDTIAVDVVADLFENVQKKSLNDQLHGDIQIGLNDRIAFVKNLFDGSQEDFNRVVSQLNTFKTEKEAKKFITKMVKPDYDWSEKEEYETRFMSIIERKFA